MYASPQATGLETRLNAVDDAELTVCVRRIREMLSITFQFNESARIRVCFMLCALTFLGVGLSTLYLLAVRHLSSSVAEYTSLVEGYDADYLVTALTYLASVAVVLDVLGLCASYAAMYPERRERSQLKLFVMTLAQLCLVVAFAVGSVLCYTHADRVSDSFKVPLPLSLSLSLFLSPSALFRPLSIFPPPPP